MKILIAEDEESIAEQYKAVLEASNHQVILSKDGEECVKLFNAAVREDQEKSSKNQAPRDGRSPPFGLVILDFSMPKKNGILVAEHILSLCPSQRIFMATAYPEDTISTWAKHLERSVDVFQKPIDLDLFLAVIEEIGQEKKLAQ